MLPMRQCRAHLATRPPFQSRLSPVSGYWSAKLAISVADALYCFVINGINSISSILAPISFSSLGLSPLLTYAIFLPIGQ